MIERSRDAAFGAPARKARTAGRRRPPHVSPWAARKSLRENIASVEYRVLPHLRRAPRSLRPAWVERKVRELVA